MIFFLGQAIALAVDGGYIASLIPIQAVYSNFPQEHMLKIHGKLSEDARAAIEVAHSVAAGLGSCESLKTRQIQIQVGDLTQVNGSSIGLGTICALISLSTGSKVAYAVSGAVDIGGGINPIGKAQAKALIAERSDLRSIFPYGDKKEIDDLALKYAKGKEPIFLNKVEQLLKLMENPSVTHKFNEDTDLPFFSIGH